MAAKKPKSPRLVQSVDRALRALETLAAEPAGVSLFDLAARLGLAPQTVQGLVRTLQYHGLVAQAGKGAPYTVGPALAALSTRWNAAQDRAALAREAVLELAGRLDEYLLLAELRGDELFPLVEARSTRELAVTYQQGWGRRMHTMATGKVLLAHADEDRRAALMAGLDLSSRGPRALTSRQAIEEELARVLRDGFAICRDEGAEGVSAVAVPLRDAAGAVVAALGASLPTSRFPTGRRRELVAELNRTAAQIEKLWGR